MSVVPSCVLAVRWKPPGAVTRTAVACSGAGPNTTVVSGRSWSPPSLMASKLASGGATPPSAGQLPPQFMKCMADQGFPIESPDQIHSAPQTILQAFFGALHGGGAGP